MDAVGVLMGVGHLSSIQFYFTIVPYFIHRKLQQVKLSSRCLHFCNRDNNGIINSTTAPLFQLRGGLKSHLPIFSVFFASLSYLDSSNIQSFLLVININSDGASLL